MTCLHGCVGAWVGWKGNWVVLIPKEKIQVYPNPSKRIEESSKQLMDKIQSVSQSYYYLYFDSLTFSHISPTNSDFSGGGPISNMGKVISQACPVFIHSSVLILH